MTRGLLCIGLILGVVGSDPAAAPTPPVEASSALVDAVLARERQRVELMERLTPAVVCVSDTKERGGGSGVVIDPEGYGLTNYHVVTNLVEKRMGWGGLSDGKLYELEVLGLDPTGDVAMFKLSGKERFDFVEIGDSDTVRLGDTTIAMGNPFALSEDYTPSVSMGLVTGVHRYQWGTGNNLIYSDSIQFDTSINPGSSGGPLFDLEGRVVGINGRISVNTRGRFNVGFGYAISINQIKRFLPSLRAGLLARHGTLQATVEDVEDVGVVFTEVLRHAAAYNAGIRVGDKLLALDGVAVASRNQVASLIGTYPERWPVRLRVERDGSPMDLTVRLEGIPPKVSKKFEPNRGVNLREVERVLRRFQGLVLGRRENANATNGVGVPERGWPRTWRWTFTRETAPGESGAAGKKGTFSASQAEDRKAQMFEVHEKGTSGRILEYDTVSAVWRPATGEPLDRPSVDSPGSVPAEETFQLPLESRLVLGAFYLLQRKIAAWQDVNDLNDVSHLGGEGLLFQDAKDAVPRLVDLLEWRLDEHAVARLAFETDSGLLKRLTVEHTPSGVEAQVDLSDYRTLGGIYWPSAMEVRCGTWQFRDSWTNVEVGW
jgi:S1-C subfamily serine protease